MVVVVIVVDEEVVDGVVDDDDDGVTLFVGLLWVPPVWIDDPVGVLNIAVEQRLVPIIIPVCVRPLPLVPPPPVPAVPATIAIAAVLAGAPVVVADGFVDSEEMRCCLEEGALMELVTPPQLGSVDDVVGNGGESGGGGCCCCGCDDSGRDRGSKVEGVDDNEVVLVLWSETDNATDEGTGPGVEAGGGIQSDT